MAKKNEERPKVNVIIAPEALKDLEGMFEDPAERQEFIDAFTNPDFADSLIRQTRFLDKTGGKETTFLAPAMGKVTINKMGKQLGGLLRRHRRSTPKKEG